MNKTSSALKYTFCFLLSAALSSLQAAELSGYVTESSSGTALEGARVMIPELQLETTANRRGFYSFDDIDPGTYTVIFRYVGAEAKKVENVPVNESNDTLNTPLNLGVYVMDEYVVTSFESASVRALNIQRSSENLRDVIASDYSGQFADTNAAEALNRLPGVSVERDQGEGRFVVIRGIDPNLNSVAIDGIKLAAPSTGGRSTLLDTIPIEVLDTLEVTKAVLPSQPGDSIGGYINLRTPSAFNYDGRTTNLNSAILYSDLVEKTGYKFNASFSDYFGKDKNWGLYVSAVRSERTFGSDNVEADPWEEEGAGFVSEEIQYREFDLRRERTGIAANLEFKPSEDSLFFLRASYNNYQDTEVRDLANMIFDGEFFDVSPNQFSHRSVDDFNADDNETEYPGISSEIELKEREENLRIYVTSIGGEQTFADWTVDYALSMSKAEEDTPFDREAIYVNEGPDATPGNVPVPGNVGLGGGPIFTNTASYKPRLNNPAIIPGYTGIDYSDPSAFAFDELTIGNQLVEETDLSAQANLKREFDSKLLNYIQFGGVVRSKEKESDAALVSADDDTGIETADLFPVRGPRNPFGRPVPGLNTGLFDFAQDNLPFVAETVDSIIEDYETNEDVLAAYLMGSFQLTEWEIIAGARVEYTDFETDGFSFNDDTGVIDPVGSSKDYTNFLPGIHVRREFGENFVFRASWTNTIARPTFEQSRPGIVREGNEVERGNPDLDPYEAMNLDASIQYYNETYGIFGVAVFYKDIEDFIYEQTFDEGPDEITTFENGDSGEILGLELSYSKQFSNLPGMLSGLSFSSNLTLTDSEADAQRPGGGALAQTSFIKQSDVIGNVSVAWEYSNFLIRLSGSYRDAYLDEIGEESFQDRYIDDYFIVNLYSGYKLTDHFTVYAELNNLNNEPLRAYWGDTDRLSQYEEYGVSGALGVKWSY